MKNKATISVDGIKRLNIQVPLRISGNDLISFLCYHEQVYGEVLRGRSLILNNFKQHVKHCGMEKLYDDDMDISTTMISRCEGIVKKSFPELF